MDQHPFKCLAMEKACDRKTDMTCLCTTCGRGCAELVLSMSQSVCVVVAVFADDVIVMGIFLGSGVFYYNIHIILLTNRGKFWLPASVQTNKITHQSLTAKDIRGEIRLCKTMENVCSIYYMQSNDRRYKRSSKSLKPSSDTFETTSRFRNCQLPCLTNADNPA